MSMSLK
jgi:hypothetical protein